MPRAIRCVATAQRCSTDGDRPPVVRLGCSAIRSSAGGPGTPGGQRRCCEHQSRPSHLQVWPSSHIPPVACGGSPVQQLLHYSVSWMAFDTARGPVCTSHALVHANCISLLVRCIGTGRSSIQVHLSALFSLASRYPARVFASEREEPDPAVSPTRVLSALVLKR